MYRNKLLQLLTYHFEDAYQKHEIFSGYVRFPPRTGYFQQLSFYGVIESGKLICRLNEIRRIAKSENHCANQYKHNLNTMGSNGKQQPGVTELN